MDAGEHDPGSEQGKEGRSSIQRQIGNFSEMAALFHIEMLGRFGVRQGDREITRFRTQKTAVLLAYLALYRARSHPRDLLIELLWPQSELKAARTNLSVALNALRRQLEPPGVPQGAVLLADHFQVRLNPFAFTTDVEDFEKALREAEAEAGTDQRATLWMTAVDLYRGDLLPGFYGDWVLSERDRLHDAYLFALRQVVRKLAETRQYEMAIEYAHRTVQADPLREESYRNLMRLYLVVGRPEEARYQYQTLERLLHKELQAAPSAATRQLAEQLKQTTGEMGTRGITLELHRHRDTERRAAWKALSAEEKAPPCAPRPAPSAWHLPFQFTRFFGREEEITQLLHLLTPPSSEGARRGIPLLTLTGPGGTGKTRLAIEVAERLKETLLPALWFVPLAELDDPLRLGEALRDALQLPRQTYPPALEQVITFLNGREGSSLLLLDNFEQIAAGGAPVVWTLLQRVPSLRCLVTSRRPLGLPGEREFPVLPLPIPEMQPQRPDHPITQSPDHLITPEHLMQYPSVQLFVDRAQAARPEFQITPQNAGAIAAICERLEGIPLALELAAARARVLTPAQMLERLNERFDLLTSRRADKGERHRSLWAAIDWSYRLLPPELRRLFGCLSVFRGGWSLEAAESVCKEPRALDYLSQLRGHSLILAEESSVTIRFRMLETIREFAGEVLDESEKAALRQSHLAFFLTLAETASPHLKGPEQAAWLDRLETEHDNLRAALKYSMEEERKRSSSLSSPPASALRLTVALQQFWWTRGHLSEGRQWSAAALSQKDAQERTRTRANALNGAGNLARMQGDYASAGALHQESLSIYREIGDREGMSYALNNLGIVAKQQADYTSARAYYEESLAIHREMGNWWAIAGSLNNLGIVAKQQADYTSARALYEEALVINRQIGNRAWEAANLNGLGGVAYCQGDYAAARTLLEESLTIRRELGDRGGIASSLHSLGMLAQKCGDAALARSLYEEALAIRRELSDPQGFADPLNSLAALAREQGDPARARAYLAECLALCRELGSRYVAALGLENFAALVYAQNRPERAVCLYGAAAALRESIGAALPPEDRKEADLTLNALRAALGEAAFAAAFDAGRALDWEQAIAYALEETDFRPNHRF